MIALLIGGTVVLCIGLLTLVFGIPIKEFSFGNTMIVVGAIIACTGLLLVGLYFVSRELRNLVQRLDAGLPFPPAAGTPRERGASPAVAKPSRGPRARSEDTLFTGDQPRDFDEFEDSATRASSSLPPANAPSMSESWQDEPLARQRPQPPAPADFGSPSGERPRRDIVFSSKRRDQQPLDTEIDLPSAPPPFNERDGKPETLENFDDAWPQADRGRQEPVLVRNGRANSAATRESADAPRERFQPPRRAEASSVSIVKSGVVDSMAYSLYSDGSIEAQMPEGMVRFASIDELRTHLDQR